MRSCVVRYTTLRRVLRGYCLEGLLVQRIFSIALSILRVDFVDTNGCSFVGGLHEGIGGLSGGVITKAAGSLLVIMVNGGVMGQSAGTLRTSVAFELGMDSGSIRKNEGF